MTSTASSSSTTTAVVSAAALAAVAASVVTYAATVRSQKKRERLLRSETYDQAVVEKREMESSQKAQGKPSGTMLPSVKIDEVYLWEVERLGKYFRSESTGLSNKMHGVGVGGFRSSMVGVSPSRAVRNPEKEMTPYNKLVETNECVIADIVRKPSSPVSSSASSSSSPSFSRAYVRAGPRESLHFDPRNLNAAIVTCGGLCPGLNNVIREITNSLFYLYGVRGKVYGIRGGYKGFYDPDLPPLELTPEVVENIHHEGGTVLSSSRGGFDLEKILEFIHNRKVRQLYVIGGDGTHRGAFRIHEGCMERGMNVAVAGIPKTIDNDVDHIDRSFGFASAVESAQTAIRTAKTEAACNLPNGIGIVKLMGRSAGFIAVHATMGSGDVDLCLVPEIPIVLEGEKGCLPHLRRIVKSRGFAVAVVAEGAGEELLGTSAEVDASGNKKLPKIGEFLKGKVEEHFANHGETATVKYIDPSYMIRSVPANAVDSLYCMQLAQNAVHGAMAGFTGFSVGLCNDRMVYLPIPELCATSPRMMNPRGRTWERILALTRQPNTVKEATTEEERNYDSHAPTLR